MSTFFSKLVNKSYKKRRKGLPFMLLTKKHKIKFVTEMVNAFELEYQALGRKMSVSNKLQLTYRLCKIINLEPSLLH